MPSDPEVYLPAIHVLHLGEVTARYGVTSGELMQGMGFEGRDLTRPDERISIEDAAAIAERAFTLTGEPALAWLLGLQLRISAYGYVGFAAMVASTLGEAISLVAHFTPTRTNAVGMRLVREPETAAVVIEELAPLGGAREMIVVSLMESTRQIGRAITGEALRGRLEVAAPQPAYYERIRDAFPDVHFGCDENRLVFDAAMLDLRLVLGDPSALHLAMENCERELLQVRDAHPIAARVRAVLARRGGLSATLEGVAATLGTSTRTVKRRLASEGTAFSTLLDEARREEGLRLVASSSLSLEAIAERLGYANLASFHRAYKRWTGKAPSADR
jgi:AraC-like DNA-binding protein